jgi:hypothetical protein
MRARRKKHLAGKLLTQIFASSNPLEEDSREATIITCMKGK